MRIYGVSCFVAHEDIEPTKEWQDEIERALFSMHALVPLLTEGFHDSNWTDQEVGVAIGRGVPVIAVKLGVDPYGFIGKFQAFQAHGKAIHTVAEQLHELLIKHPSLSEFAVESLITRLESSESYQQSNTVIDLLAKHLKTVTPAAIDRLEAAGISNTQVRDAFGVQAKLPQLVRRLRSAK